MQAKISLNTTSSGAEEVLLDRWLNEGVVDVLLQTRCKVDCGDLTTTADEWKYTTPTAILALLDITYQSASSSNTSGLERVTPAEILRLREQAGSDSGGPPRYYALAGNDLLMLHPTPATVDTISILYVPRPSALSATANDPSSDTYGGVPAEYHKAIEYYALWQAGDYDDDNTSNWGLGYRQTYMELIAQFRKAMRRKGGRSLGRARVGRRPLRPHDNSQDIGAW